MGLAISVHLGTRHFRRYRWKQEDLSLLFKWPHHTSQIPLARIWSHGFSFFFFFFFFVFCLFVVVVVVVAISWAAPAAYGGSQARG